jgi:hypothetical protein
MVAVVRAGAPHVERDSRHHATALAVTMVEHGLPHRAVKARTLQGTNRR